MNNELKELKEEIEGIEINYDYEECYNKLYNACIDYENETQDFIFGEILENYIDLYTAEEIAKEQLESGGLTRLYYLMGDVNFNTAELIYINGYGNFEEVYKEDIERLKQEILDTIDYNMEEEN